LHGFEEPFHELWRYYLMYCEGGFRARLIDVAQVTMVKEFSRRKSGELYRP
jgi:cyclopropane-fatty-acyl-phospholipid synthase